MTSRCSQLVAWMKAAGEPSRFRLLVLCAQRDLSVSDLASALGQSEPRVSRHLKILCEAGLIERLPQGQWVHYRLSRGAPTTGFVQGLLAQLDRGDPQVGRDMERALAGAWGDRMDGGPGGRAVVAGRAQAGASRVRAMGAAGDGRGAPDAGGHNVAKTSESRLGRALKDFIEANTPPDRLASALLVGVDHLELLESAARIAGQCTAIAHSRRAAQSAKAFGERRGFNCRVLLAATSDGLCERDIDRAGRSFDVVILDHLATADTDFAGLLGYGRRALAPSGRMWLFERYESLETSPDKVTEHPLARLRRLLGDLGLSCERLSPIEADGEHVLAAIAAPAANRVQPTLRRA